MAEQTESPPSLFGPSAIPRSARLKRYRDVMTADVNEKGVLDVDTVKGCTAGMSARPGTGCYGACYAATIAKFRGLDFAQAVPRYVTSYAQAASIERAVAAAPEGFFRIGTMGDPCHAWEHTVRTVEWLAPLAVPVIVTKHWHVATDEQLDRLVVCGTVLNTSVSALDTPAELRHREKQIARYAAAGGVSVARIVSCDFNRDCDEGREMAAIQDRLFTLRPMIDNPLRAASTHDLVRRGVIRLHSVRDLVTVRGVSLSDETAYVGHCATCPDKCGLVALSAQYRQPPRSQFSLWGGTK